MQAHWACKIIEYKSDGKSDKKREPTRCFERQHQDAKDVNPWKHQSIEKLHSIHHQYLEENEKEDANDIIKDG